MIRSRLCDLIGIKYPIIQAGMGPFSNNNLGVAAANAGVLGLLSTSGVFDKEFQPWIYKSFVSTAGADYDDDIPTVMEKLLKRTYNLVKDKGGIFGINVMVSAEVLRHSHVIVDTAIKVREENPMKSTSAESRRWVPITMSTDPLERRAAIFFCSAGGLNRLNISTLTGKASKRSRNVLKCCMARIVVGTRTTTCLPSFTALKAARIATSVLP